MTETVATQSDLLCRNCSGQCAFDPAQQDLLCQNCGTLWPLASDTDHEAALEFPFDPDKPQRELPSLLGEHVHQCETCGGAVVFTGPALSEGCPYCNGPVVLTVEGKAYETMALVPFRIDRSFAERSVTEWISDRFAAPDDLGHVISKGSVAGIYAPFWTFDSSEAIEYWASYTTGSGDKRRRHHVSNTMNVHFDDLLVPASEHVTPLIRDGILHDFQPGYLRPYKAGYLAGFAAERHHWTVGKGLRMNAQDKDLLIRNRIKKHVGKSGTRVDRYRTDTSGIHYRRILLPVWIMHYTYGGKPKRVVVSGIDGRTFGERPFSPWKLAAYSACLTAVTMMMGLTWGASTVP